MEIVEKSFEKKDAAIIFIAGVVLFLTGLPPEFLALDARFAVFAQEMMRSGPTFFPTTYGTPYPDYPGTGTFMIYLASLPFGHVTMLSAILPTAIVSSLVLVVTYGIGALRSRKWGIAAVLLMLFTKSFFALSRTISPDMYVTLFTSLCFYVCYSATLLKRPRRLWLVPFLALGGFAFRGPIGLIVPAAVACGYLFFNKEYKRFILVGLASFLMLIIGLLSLFAAAKYQGGQEFIKVVMNWQVGCRIPYNKSHPYTYYWTGAMGQYAVSYILALIVIAAMIREIVKPKTQEYRLLQDLTLWMLVVMVGFTIPGVKKMRYILPACPAFSLIGAYLLVGILEKPFLVKVRDVFVGICNVLPYGVCVFCGVALLFWSQFNIDFQPHLLAAFLAMCGVAAGSFLLLRRQHDPAVKELIKVGAAALTVIVLIVCFSETAFYQKYRSKPFVNAVSSQLEQRSGQLAFYKVSSDAEAIKFLVNYEKPISPVFIGLPEEILTLKPGTVFICMEEDYQKLPAEIVDKLSEKCTGRLDGVDCICFTVATSNNG